MLKPCWGLYSLISHNLRGIKRKRGEKSICVHGVLWFRTRMAVVDKTILYLFCLCQTLLFLDWNESRPRKPRGNLLMRDGSKPAGKHILPENKNNIWKKLNLKKMPTCFDGYLETIAYKFDMLPIAMLKAFVMAVMQMWYKNAVPYMMFL